MSLSNQIFQKELNDIKLDDLVEFFKDGRQESSTLEFKTGDAEVESITREVCAFLNTDGGILVYGAPKEKEIANGNKHCIGEIIPTTKVKNKVSLASSIAANISPSPTNLKVHQIDSPNGLIFIIETPKSIHPPHQVSKEGKYYIRLDTEAKPAPHGLVEALFFKRQKPNLDLQITIDYQTDNLPYYILKFSVENDSDFTAESIGYVFEIFGIEKIGDTNRYLDTEFEFKKRKVICRSQYQNPVIVKGISLSIALPFAPCRLNKVVIKCLIWCKDLNARSYCFSFEPLNYKQPEELYYSEIDSQKPDYDSLLAPYYSFLDNIN